MGGELVVVGGWSGVAEGEIVVGFGEEEGILMARESWNAWGEEGWWIEYRGESRRFNVSKVKGGQGETFYVLDSPM